MNSSQHLIRIVASILSMGAILWPAATAFGQEVPGSVARPATDAAVIPAPAGGTRAIIVENSGTVSVIVLPAEAAGWPESAVAPSYASPLDNPTTSHSPMTSGMPWDMSPPSTSDVRTSTDPPLNGPYGPGSSFGQTPWQG